MWKRQLFGQSPELQVFKTSPALFDGVIIVNTKLLEYVQVPSLQFPSVTILTKLGNNWPPGSDLNSQLATKKMPPILMCSLQNMNYHR